MIFAIRDDDTAFFTKPEELDSAYDFVREGTVSLSVVPCSVFEHRDDVFPYSHDEVEIKNNKYYFLDKNKRLVKYLKDSIHEGKYEILLHGYTHEYMYVNGRWLPEMIWKDKSQLEHELKFGKDYLENLLSTSIKVFVAPNNAVDNKAISIISDLGLDYSGIIYINDRKLTYDYLVNFYKRWKVRITKGIPYPGVLNYGDHKELVAYTLDNLSRLKKEYLLCKKKEVPFVVYTHYWMLNQNPDVKKLLIDIYNFAIADGAKLVKLSECFG